jgi:hypothetical protein
VRDRRPLALTGPVVGLALLAGACGNQTSGGSTSVSPVGAPGYYENTIVGLRAASVRPS